MRGRPEPFYRTSKKCWYVQFGKQQIRLGKTKREAYEEYDKLLADRHTLTPAVPVVLVLAQFLQWAQKRRSQKTYDWYQMHLQSFTKHVGKRLKVSALQPKHITAWIDHSHTRSSDSTRHGAIRAVQRAFNWAVKEGHLSRNPIANAEKPSPTKREVVITEKEFQGMLKMATDQAEKDLLTVLWETGCRPQEIRIVAAKHFDEPQQRWVFETSNSKGKKVQRVVYLTDAALGITKRLAAQYPEGPIFRNREGQPWNKNSIRCRFRKFRKLGIEGLCATAIRHSFTTHALARGVDSVTLASPLGHSDVTTLSRHYAHLIKRPDHMQKTIRLARGQDALPPGSQSSANPPA